MGKKLDALLGRSFKASKFKALVNLAISRLAVLKNQKQARLSLARNDVVQLLNLGHHERALLRVEQVIKEQNMLDVFVMIEGYCILLSERVKVMEHDKVCPDELKEAISGLIFAASRCGEFPELTEMRAVFTSRYGKEFSARAIELRNHCGVSPKMIQKLSTRQPSLDARMNALKEIADENGIALNLEESSSIAAEEKLNRKENQSAQNQSASFDSSRNGDDSKRFSGELDGVEGITESIHRKKQYKDVADAAQEAFMSAAYAAAAARAAVELSRSYPRAPDDHNDPNNQRKQVFDSNDEVKVRPETKKDEYSRETKDPVFGLDKVHSFDKLSLDSDDEVTKEETEVPEITHIKQVGPRSSSIMFPGALEKDKELQRKVEFDESDDEARSAKFNSQGDDNPWGGRAPKLRYFSQKQTPSSFPAGSSTDQKTHFFAGLTTKSAQRTNTEKRLHSVRTRR